MLVRALLLPLCQEPWSQLIPVNPCDRVTPPSIPPVEMRFLTAGEVVDLADAIGPWYRAFIFTAAYGGLR